MLQVGERAAFVGAGEREKGNLAEPNKDPVRTLGQIPAKSYAGCQVSRNTTAFALMSTGKLWWFDATGNQHARRDLRSSKVVADTRKAVLVSVNGTADGDIIRVLSLTLRATATEQQLGPRE